MNEKIKIVFINNTQLEFKGKYLGHVRPDGKIAKNWHYYKKDNDVIIHIPKDKILYVESDWWTWN